MRTSEEKKLVALAARMKVIKRVREFFVGRGFEEVVTGVLGSGVPLEPTIYPLVARAMGGEQEFYLPISPERAMKQLLALGMDKIYTIGHCFRGLEAESDKHASEFLMLEWYRQGVDYRQIMEETVALINFVTAGFGGMRIVGGEAWQRLSIDELWSERFGLSLEELENDELMSKFAKRLGYQTQNSTWEQNFHQIFLNEIENDLPKERLLLDDFPARISPLCARREDKPWLAERFEGYFRGLEIGNGNSENLEVEQIRDFFEQERAWRLARGEETAAVDEGFLAAVAAMKATGKKFAGMGVGIERLVMAVAKGVVMGDFVLDDSLEK